MKNLHVFLLCVLALTLLACGEESNETMDMFQPDVTRQLGDQYVTPSPDGGTEPGDAMPLADMRTPTPVTDCTSLCERLSECSSGLLGDATSCEDACNTLTSYDGYDAFVSCVDGAACNELAGCRMPEPPPPSCGEVCGALDSCEPATRLPESLADVETCADACADPARSEAIGVCGRSIAEGISECSGDVFSRCLAERLYPICSAVCDRKLECEVESDYIDCLVDCAAPSSETDPVTRRRARLRQTCWQTAADCDVASICDEPTNDPQYDPTALCVADEMCNQIDQPCAQTVTALSLSIAHDALDCVAQSLSSTCDASLTSCFTQGNINPLYCDEYCAVAMLCEQLPEGQAEFDCSTNCRAAVDGSAEDVARFRRPTSCAYVNTCEEFSVCLAQSGGADICASACSHLSSCEQGAIDPMACEETCDAASTLRQEAFYTCNAIIDACTSPQQCAVPPAPDCTTICDGLNGCGLEAVRCLQTCDDNAYLQPDDFIETYACHAVARNCPDHERCQNGERLAGRACIQACRGQLECAGDQGEMLSCIDSCAAGFSGQTGVDFEFSYPCLQGLAIDATCAEIDACTMTTSSQAVCDAVCDAQSRCALLDADQTLESCQEACLSSLVADPDAYTCALRAGRVANGCIDLAECLNIDVAPASPACVTRCAARAQCDEATDQFLCERQCDPALEGTPETSIRMSCLEAHTDCVSILRCLDSPTEDPDVCIGICSSLEQCPDEIGVDGRYGNLAACQTSCGIDALVNIDADNPALSLCLGEALCVTEEIDRCFNGGASAPTCDNAWTAYEECGNDDNFLWAFVTPPVSDRASYLSFCNALLSTDGAMAIEPKLQCVIDAAANSMCDDQIACSF
jgi:hypothetical protein